MTDLSLNPSQPQDGGKRKLPKGAQRIKVQQGMTVKDVQAGGSSLQKIMASVFDYEKEFAAHDGGDGKYNGGEAFVMNQYVFAEDAAAKEFRAHRKDLNRSIAVKYNNRQEFLDNKNIVRLAEEIGGSKGNVTVDFRTKTITIDGMEEAWFVPGKSMYEMIKDFNVVIKNSTLDGFAMPKDYNGSITFDGSVEKAGLGKDIKVYVGKNTTLIPKGNDVHIKIVRDEE